MSPLRLGSVKRVINSSEFPSELREREEFSEAIRDLDERLMPDQHGLGDNGTESTRPRQSGQGDDQMNEYDREIAHPGNGINAL